MIRCAQGFKRTYKITILKVGSEWRHVFGKWSNIINWIELLYSIFIKVKREIYISKIYILSLENKS